MVIIFKSLLRPYFFIPLYSIYLTLLFNTYIFNTSIINYTNLVIPIIQLDVSYIFSIIHKYIIPNQVIFNIILSFSIYSKFFKQYNLKTTVKETNSLQNPLDLLIGHDSSHNPIFLNESSQYQNILITGAIGSGKTSGLIYPLINQLFKRPSFRGLILDVKGNMKSTILKMLDGDISNLLIIDINGSCKYNPLHNLSLEPHTISNRLISVLKLFSNNSSTDQYWYEKSEAMLTEIIRLIRTYNNNYVTFLEIHKLITDEQYLDFKLQELKNSFLENKLTKTQIENSKYFFSYFKHEYSTIDSKILSTIKSEITRLTYPFNSDSSISNVFCPKIEELTYSNFSENFKNNIVVLLQMNIGKYHNVSKIIAAYLKLDFQFEILKGESFEPTFFICDEYHEYATENDANFFSLSREYKCLNIVATQSFSSLFLSLHNEKYINVILQNLVNKIFLRTDDIYTIECAQKIFGKEEKIRKSSSLSENSNETNYNFLLNNMHSSKSNISETISTHTSLEYILDTRQLSNSLESFEAYAQVSDGKKIFSPVRLNLQPYFKEDK